jgi:lysophospholipase L1-like esterase
VALCLFALDEGKSLSEISAISAILTEARSIISNILHRSGRNFPSIEMVPVTAPTTSSGKRSLLSLGHVALVGDSIYKHLHNHFPKGLDAPSIIFRSGARIRDAMEMIDSLPAHITHIILHIGTNNLYTDTVHDAFTDMLVLITHIQHKRPGTIVTLTGILPRLPNGHQNNANRWVVDEFNNKAGNFNSTLVNLVENHQFSGVGLVLHREFRTRPAAFLARDGIHPNFRGVEAIAHSLKQYFLDKHIYKVHTQTTRTNGTTGLQTIRVNKTTHQTPSNNTVATQCQLTHISVGTQCDLLERSGSRTDHYAEPCPPTVSVATQCDPPAANGTSEIRTSPKPKKTSKRITRKRIRTSPNQTTPPTDKPNNATDKQNTNMRSPTNTQTLVTPTGKTLVSRRTGRSN